MKCQRCGNDEVRQEGYLMFEAVGSDATQTLTYRGVKGIVVTRVCDAHALELRRLGWR